MWKQVLIGCGSVFALATAALAQGSVITTSAAVAVAPLAVFLVPGDIVGLKSGGPRMTVERISTFKDGFVECVWFDDKDRKSGSFAVADLVVYTHRVGGALVLGQ
jgi:uncharacterized protein YodC (DUF2158 family)